MYSLLSFLVIFIFFIIFKCHGEIIQFGDCKEVKTVVFFDLQRFLGEWYEIKRYPTWYEQGGECGSKVFTACGRRIGIEHKYVKNEIEYIIHLNSTYAPGDDAVFEFNPTNVDPIGIPLSVLATDYNNYAILFGCKSNDQFKIRYISAWILSRNPYLDPDILDDALKFLNTIPMTNNAYFLDVRHDNKTCRHHWTAHINIVSNDL